MAQAAGIKVHFKDYRIGAGERVSFWPQGETGKINNGSIAKSSSLLLCVQSEAPISQDLFAISRDYSMGKNDLASQDTDKTKHLKE